MLLQRQIQPDPSLDALVGASRAMTKVRDLIRRAAAAPGTVLITGETGTGKELAARAIHASGPRAPRAFVAVNCAALTESLLEAELFGHAKGAFTGASGARAGLIEHAEGGTLFLDEIGTLSKGLQAKLLRALESGEVRRVGENDSRTRRRPVRRRHEHRSQGRDDRRGVPKRPVLPPRRSPGPHAAPSASAAMTSRCSSSTSWRATGRAPA